MNNTPGDITTSGNRVGDGRDDECCRHPLGDGIAHNAVREHVFHPAGIQVSLARFMFCDVREP